MWAFPVFLDTVPGDFSRYFLSSSQLEKEVAGLREKIHHLDDMLKSQQRKVRQMIEQVMGKLGKNLGKSREKTGKTLGKKWGKIPGKNREKGGKNRGKPEENPGKF